jgi:anti-sigma B factor antagonist
MGQAEGRDFPVADVSETGDAVVVRLAGELDLYTAPAVRAALLESIERRPARLVVDLADVTFIDSTALGALVEARARVGTKDGLVLAAPGLEARRALEVSGLHRHFEVRETLEDALKD